jgi:hypothetical protein
LTLADRARDGKKSRAGRYATANVICVGFKAKS